MEKGISLYDFGVMISFIKAKKIKQELKLLQMKVLINHEKVIVPLEI